MHKYVQLKLSTQSSTQSVKSNTIGQMQDEQKIKSQIDLSLIQKKNQA